MNEQSLKTFAYSVIGIVVVAIIAGFMLVGSPNEQRLRRFDEQRVSDLANIQYQVVYYWQSKTRLPENMSMLTDSIGGFQVPKDPQTQTLYEYTITGDKSFSLCATFSRPSIGQGIDYDKAVPYMDSREGNWQHGQGRVCFDRTIDPDRYPPINKNFPITPVPAPAR